MENNDSRTIIKVDGPVSLNTSVELPIDGLPPSIQRFVNAVCEVYHCPREFVVSSVFATAATAVGKKIKTFNRKYYNYPILWFVNVARSGSNKTFPMKLVTDPLRDIDYELFQNYLKELKEWEDIPKKDQKGEAPKCPGITIDDCTDEQRAEILYLNSEAVRDTMGYAASKRGLLGYHPEVKGMFDSQNQYKSGGSAGISKLLKLFDGDSIKIDRRASNTMYVKDPFFCILSDLQIGMIRSTFGSEMFMTNGLNQRFLFCYVENIVNPDFSVELLSSAEKYQWKQTVNMLYEGIYHSPTGQHVTLFRNADGIVSYSDEAQRLHDEYYNKLQRKKDNVKSDYEATLFSKLQIQINRIVGVVHALEVAEEKGERVDYNVIHASTMEYAIRCMAYFEAMAFKVYDKICDHPEAKQTTETSAEFICKFFDRYPKVTQNQFANLVGVSPAYISKILKK